MIRDLREDEVTFEVTAEQDDLSVRGNALASGDDDEDRKCEDEILRRLDQGDVWAWASVRVTARWNGYEGHNYLGACCYRDEEDFITCGDYYEDMKREALRDLNETLRANAEKLEALKTQRALTCDMEKGCDGVVTNIDAKGYVYCAPHGAQRRASGIRCRKLRPAEKKRLENGQSISYSRRAS